MPGAAGRSLDIAGPDVLSYGDMIERIADAMGVGRMPLGFGASLTPAGRAPWWPPSRASRSSWCAR